MTWNCSCKKVNDDNQSKCGKCGRIKPKYLGVKIDISGDIQFDSQQFSLWNLMLANNYLIKAKKKLNKLIEYLNQENTTYDKANATVKLNCDNIRSWVVKYANDSIKLAQLAAGLFDEISYEQEEILLTPANLISDSFYTIADSYYFTHDYGKAIEWYQQSYDADPNQISIYSLAISTQKLPVEGTSVFSSKKTNQAKENKKEQEMELFKKTIRFSPFTEIALKAAEVLKEDYKYLIQIADLV